MNCHALLICVLVGLSLLQETECEYYLILNFKFGCLQGEVRVVGMLA